VNNGRQSARCLDEGVSLGEMTQLAFRSSVGCLERGRWAGEQNKKDFKKYTNKAGMCMKTKKTGGKMSAFIAQLLGKLQIFRVILAKLGRNCNDLKLNWLKFTPNRNGVGNHPL
jgi:hypothetical protein